MLALSHGLYVSPLTMRYIRRVVVDLLADPAAREFTKHPVPALDRHNANDNDYLRLCTLRAATVFALVKDVADAERKVKKPDAARRSLNKRQANGIGVVGHDVLSIPSAVELTITALYAYARGLSLGSGESCLMMPDSRLRDLLPHVQHLHWYGLSEARRYQIVAQSDPRRPKSTMITAATIALLKEVRIYTEKMPTGSLQRIQHAISVVKQNALPILGLNMDLLSEIFNVMLPDYSQLRTDTEDEEEDVHAQLASPAPTGSEMPKAELT
jgi:hypothetical protein